MDGFSIVVLEDSQRYGRVGGNRGVVKQSVVPVAYEERDAEWGAEVDTGRY